MERCKTARCAVELMGKLAVEHGFYGDASVMGAGENLMVNDPEEGWTIFFLGTIFGAVGAPVVDHIVIRFLAAIMKTRIIHLYHDDHPGAGGA